MARFKLKRKSFGIAGALFGAKNWAAAKSGVKTLADGTTKTLGLGGRSLETAKGLGKSAATLGGGALAIGGTAAGVGAYKAGGGDLISGGEKSAKEMEFS
jgi:hypothetical protein